MWGQFEKDKKRLAKLYEEDVFEDGVSLDAQKALIAESPSSVSPSRLQTARPLRIFRKRSAIFCGSDWTRSIPETILQIRNNKHET